jgi:hypothetical protein
MIIVINREQHGEVAKLVIDRVVESAFRGTIFKCRFWSDKEGWRDIDLAMPDRLDIDVKPKEAAIA